MEDIRETIDERMENLFSKLELLEAGSKEASAVIDEIGKLNKISEEVTKNEREFMQKCDAETREEEKHQITMQESQQKMVTEKWKIGTEIGKVVVPALTYIGLFLIGIDWEGENTFTSSFLKRLVGMLRPDK